MTTFARVAAWAALMIALALASGCAGWQRGWEAAPGATFSRGEVAPEVADEVAHLSGQADEAAGVRRIVEVYAAALERDPGNAAYLSGLANHEILYGAAYAAGRKDKAYWYRRALAHAEQAMLANEGFALAVASGASFGAAVDNLGERDLDAMFFWSQALNYYFKECLSPLAYPFNMGWVNLSRELIERMWAMDPEFRQGGVYFARAVYLLALPESMGGDMAASFELFEDAMAKWPGSMLFPWGRAKYWAQKAGDRDLFVSDLSRVAAMDPERATGQTYGWNVYFHRDAATMLEKTGAR